MKYMKKSFYLSIVACVALFSVACFYALTYISNSSYRVITVFLLLILLSNLCAKACLSNLKQYGEII